MGAFLSVSEVAGQVDLSAHTLRWYERLGLVGPIGRDSAGRRRYAEQDVERLRFLCKLRDTGMPVRDMIRYVELINVGDTTNHERLEILVSHRARVVAQIDALQKDLKVIDWKIDFYTEATS
ncbi:putative transcriptional regulator, MerR family protein [Virgisporangium aliadipatigenens]|uniref:Putative transcriptional regulator, MerR family protein n=1 Tax=Virgisporangium aliadipatigenens TaxID=741659 RepID=A0A8J4DSR8_9ACTN|nr:MerR family transcriptional regulator [Virgisporangium aliadipatigenens]GIJ49525.1 putative transcriptional regulator, MerR family protein [Virgisporangium aliadipatigenens]